jgi:hypothetical protein
VRFTQQKAFISDKSAILRRRSLKEQEVLARRSARCKRTVSILIAGKES